MHVRTTLHSSQWKPFAGMGILLTYNPPNQNTKNRSTFLRTGTWRLLMTKKGSARIIMSKIALGSSNIRTISPYGIQCVVGWTLRDRSYAALIGVHPKIVKHTVMMNHNVHKPIVISTHRMRLGVVLNRARYIHKIEILTAVITKGKCMLPIHNNYGRVSLVSLNELDKT